MAAERHPQVGDVIFSRGNNADDGDAWDDTELIEAWDAALADYKSHHSKEAGTPVAPFSSIAKALDTKRKQSMESTRQPEAKRVRVQAGQAIAQGDTDENENGPEEREEEAEEEEAEEEYQEEEGYQEEEEKEGGHGYATQDPSWYGYQHQQQPGYPAAATPGMPPLPTDNQDLSNLIMAWYYAGYYTGYYQGSRRR